MIREDKCIVFDVDGTLCATRAEHETYSDVAPRRDVIQRLREYRDEGFYIILFTARQMRTHQGNLGLLTAKTARTLMDWLDQHEVPYDELHMGKPWPGRNGFYVDDRAIRPDEFLRLDYAGIQRLLESP